MICVVQSHGTSFAGLSRYMLHDKQAETAERVAWTHNHNLATQDPELGGRIMAATAMDQQALKNLAGEAKTGRKLQKSVMHYTLSWHAEERGELTREEMIRAAEASLAALGTEEGEKLGTNKKTGKAIHAPRTQRGIEHQAVIVCHDEGDGSKPHLHVMVNRVHPEHGLALSDSKNFEKLSAWALDYRKSQGKEHYCPERAKNVALREQGYRTHNKRPSRNVYEQAKAEREAYQNDPKRAALLQQHRRKAALLKEKQDKQKTQQREEIQANEDRILREETKDRAKLAEQVRKKRNQKKTAFRERVAAQAEQHQQDRQALKEAQETVKGRVRAALDAVKSKDWISEIRSNPIRAASQAFGLALSKEQQKEQLEKTQQRDKRALQAELAKQQRAALQRLRSETAAKRESRLQEFETQRSDALLKQRMEQAKMKAEWRELQIARARDLALVRVPSPAPTEPLKPTFEKAAESEKGEKGEKSESQDGRTREEIIEKNTAEFLAMFEEQERSPDRDPDR